MDFYPSKNNNALNGTTFAPDVVTGRAMVNPHYRVFIHPATRTMCDSGAFQEDGVKRQRVTPRQALQRQLDYETWLSWQITNDDAWHFEALVHYDQMFGVDECVVDGKKIKRRGTEESARPAVAATLEAAAYYASQRHRVRGAICFTAQGVTTEQYIGCTLALLDLMRSGDWFGLGGFCIIGKVPSLKPQFYKTLDLVLPLLSRAGITRAHILGVTASDAIREASRLGRLHGVRMSTDSSSAEINGVMGRTWTDEHWRPTYTKAQKYIDYHPCQLAMQNIAAYNEWSATLETDSPDLNLSDRHHRRQPKCDHVWSLSGDSQRLPVYRPGPDHTRPPARSLDWEIASGAYGAAHCCWLTLQLADQSGSGSGGASVMCSVCGLQCR